MAQKSKPSKKKSSSSRKKTASRKTTRRSTSSRSKSGAKRGVRTTGAKSSSRSKGKGSTSQQKMSLDRKLDIAGIGLALVGLMTLLIMLSPINSSLTQGWINVLGIVFGGGKFLFPFILILGGLWLILRKFERIPPLDITRILGFVLLFFCILVILHFIYAIIMQPGVDAISLAAEGAGGGFLGAAAFSTFEAAFGPGGTAIVLIAWLIIALIMALDITVWDMVRWIPPYFERAQDWIIEKSAEIRNHRAESKGHTSYFPVPSMTHPAVVGGDVSGDSVQSDLTFDQTRSVPKEWVLPPIDQILDSGKVVDHDEDVDLDRARVIAETLASFGAPARVVEINRGPTITQFGVEPTFVETRSGKTRVRVGKIAALADDLALALSARAIRIQAPVPGKGFVGIEVPNEEISLVALRDVIESPAFERLKSPLRFALGQNVAGNAMAADLAGMPHLLIAGATGAGKSVCVNSLICCLLLHNTPNDLRLVMVDPKRVELTGYNGVPHLLAPVVVELEKVVSALQWIMREMDLRYRKLAEAGCRNIREYNTQKMTSDDPQERGKKLPYLVVVIDELADLMMLAPDETERSITRMAQLARATGIHMVIATQRPSVDVVTGLIKANFPARIAFAVASGVDSRVILDQPGAERLLGRGDMLFQAPDAPAPVRLQGVFVSDNEIFSLVNYWRSFAGLAPTGGASVGGVVDGIPSNIPLKQMSFWESGKSKEPDDPLYKESVDLVRRQGRASISMLQRRLRIGYTRAARLIDAMEELGVVGTPDPNTGTREVLDYGPAAPPVDEQ